MDDMTEALRRFGDRMEWVYPPERDDELVALMAPLFRQTGSKEGRSPVQPPRGEPAGAATSERAGACHLRTPPR